VFKISNRKIYIIKITRNFSNTYHIHSKSSKSPKSAKSLKSRQSPNKFFSIYKNLNLPSHFNNLCIIISYKLKMNRFEDRDNETDEVFKYI